MEGRIVVTQRGESGNLRPSGCAFCEGELKGDRLIYLSLLRGPFCIVREGDRGVTDGPCAAVGFNPGLLPAALPSSGSRWSGRECGCS